MHPDWLTFLTAQGALIEQNRVLHFGQPAAELAQAESGTILVDLSHLGLIHFSGEDTQHFLQSQLSCDIHSVSSEKAGYGGYCTPKGRLLSSFLVWQAVSDNSCLMQLPAEQVEAIAKRLKMFVLRARVIIQDHTGNCIRIGIAGKNTHTLLQNVLPDTILSTEPLTVTAIPDGQIICHSENRFEILVNPARAPSLWKQLSDQARCAGAAVWDWLEIREGIPAIFKVTREEFVPQMINLDAIGGVSFRKGCYPGQEIVARTQYLGKIKRRLYCAHLDVDSGINAAAGDGLFSTETGDQSCGMIVNAAPSPAGGIDVLAVIQSGSTETGSIHWKTPDGPQLIILPLPYAIT
ncbi:folate-binding protein [Nitrosomonas sp.]|uniref:CAF17-like 4Fe-4S cluster assembly/insertion protein YgfZ n=1 Tax=Nitrosomonas sp. TaxID=42353 RepID=UPI0025E36D9E|nr:folate-binding protein [Nitrosomonas sp.]MCC6916673.1 folate-binding protein YgfZ [Nitrosomonas sp.]